MQHEAQNYQRKLAEEMTIRKELEHQTEHRVGELRRTIENKQKELEMMQQKMVLPIDTDIMRMKV